VHNFFGFLKTLKMSRLSVFTKLTIGATAALAAISLSPGSAQAFVVNVGGQDWDVTTFTGSYNDNISKFETAANGGVMPWWGSQSLAGQFAAAAIDTTGSYIIFGWQLYSNGTYEEVSAMECGDILDGFCLGGYPPSLSMAWAQATAYTSPNTPVPAPLPALGVAAAFGFSRKLRKSIKRSSNAVSSSYSL